MTTKMIFAITAASIYLLIFLFFIFLDKPSIASWMFLFSPIVIIWMAYIIIRYGKYTGTELAPGEEWGYEDKRKEDFGMF